MPNLVAIFPYISGWIRSKLVVNQDVFRQVTPRCLKSNVLHHALKLCLCGNCLFLLLNSVF